jgi:diguanylate cyclase (GGDEF)-like protein
MPPASKQAHNHVVLFALTGPRRGAVFPIHGTVIHLGRGADVELDLGDDAVSGHHAHITRRSDGLYLDDDGSRNGSFVNDVRVAEPRRLLDGDHVRLGNTILRFSMLDELEERALTQLFELTVRDPLTRTYNRRFLDSHLRSELAFAARQRLSLSVLLVDIDHFKQVNDRYGHAVGDAVLQMVASCIQRLLRPYDALCRYGGEEFVVVARDTSLRNAEILAERIRRHVEQLSFDVHGTPTAVTVSVGVSSIEPQLSDGSEADALLSSVDQALYRAKETGRNRTCSRRPRQASLAPERAGLRHTAPPRTAGSVDERNQEADFRPPALPRFN